MNQAFLPDFTASHFFQNLILVFPDRVGSVLIALILTIFLGLFYGSYKGYSVPFYWILITKFFGKFTDKADRVGRSHSSLTFRGTFITVILLIFATVFGGSAVWLAQNFPLYRLLDIASLVFCTATGSIWYLIGRVHKTITRKEHKTTFFSLAVSSRTNLNYYDEHALTREAAAFGVIYLERALIAPVMGYLIFGLLGLFIVSGICAGAWLYGREGQGNGFQTLICALQRFVGIFTAPVALLSLVLSSFLVPGASIGRAFNGLFKFSGKPSYLSGGKALQVTAYSLNAVFGGGKKDTEDKPILREWTGPKGQSAKINPELLKPLQFMLFVSTLIFVCGLLVILVSIYE